LHLGTLAHFPPRRSRELSDGVVRAVAEYSPDSTSGYGSASRTLANHGHRQSDVTRDPHREHPILDAPCDWNLRWLQDGICGQAEPRRDARRNPLEPLAQCRLHSWFDTFELRPH
jgi:hypothetical protein